MMQLVRPLLSVMAVLAIGVNAQVPPRESRPITLNDAVQMALQQNFDVQIELFNPEILRYDLAGSYAIYEPALTLSYEHDFNASPGGVDREGIPLPSTERTSDSFSGTLGPGLTGYLPTGLRYQLNGFVARSEFDPPGLEQFRSGTGINLRQPLLRDFWTDAPRTQIALNRKNVEFSEWAFRRQVMQTLTAVEQAYYNLIFARESVKVQEMALELAERLLLENRRRVEVGQMAPLEVQQAESQMAANEALLIETRRSAEAQHNLLKNLVTDNYTDLHRVQLDPVERLIPLPADFDLAESWRRAIAMRPDLQQLRIDLERQNIRLRFQRNQIFPALDLVGSYGYNGLNTSYGSALDDLARRENPRYSYGVILSVPLGNREARNRLRASQAEKQQRLLQYKQLEQNILVEVDDAVRLAQSAFQRVQATRKAREFAETALEAEQRRLEAGKSTSFFVLQFQRELTSARFEEIRALAEYNNALAQLAFREGTTLERHRLDLDLR
jgi:outer membrane protein